MFNKKDILITGGLGFIGSTLAHRLVDQGAKVTIVDALISDYGGNMFNIDDIKDKVSVNIADVRDEAKMSEFIKGKDTIFNLAGTLSHIDSMKDPYTDLDINCRAQLSILESCRKNNRNVKVIFAGTRGQYGKAEYLPVDEKHPQQPTDVNGINNMAGEWYHILYNNIYGIRATSLRMTNTYGPRHQMKHHKQGVINWFIRHIIDGQEIKIYGDGKQIRDLNYVDDVVEALMLAAANDISNGEVFNLGGTPISLTDFVELAIKTAGKGSYKLIPYPPESKPIEVGDYKADHTKITKTLGWKPKVPLEEGIKKTLDYYIKNKKHYW
ncbi:NAD-dependent epimerase/dehydratase family protein [Candidatus Margulisiibacteriota bacterium]